MAISQTIDASAHATCWGMPPEVAHVVVGAVLFLFPILLTAFLVLLVRAGRKIREQGEELARVKALTARHERLWNETLFAPHGADLRARLIVRP